MNRRTLLERRIARLEKLFNERAFINAKDAKQSNAFKIWTILVDNGPSTLKEIQSHFKPSEAATIASLLTRKTNFGTFFDQRSDGKFVAIKDYKWGDIGVSDYGAKVDDIADELENEVNDIEDGEDEVNDIEDEVIEEPKPQPKRISKPVKLPFTAVNMVSVIIDCLGDKASKVNVLAALRNGVNVIDVVKSLDKKKLNKVCDTFGVTVKDVLDAIKSFGATKFSNGLQNTLRKQGITLSKRVTRINDYDDSEFDPEYYHGGDGFNNKGFDYYNNL